MAGRAACVAVFLAMFVGGCATLPDWEGDRTAADAAAAAVAFRDSSRIGAGARRNAGRRTVDALAARLDSTLLERHLADTESILGTPIVGGNAATLLVDGPRTHERMIAAIAAATRSVQMVSYIIDDGAVGTKFADALIERRQAGVRVSLMYDSVGSLDTPVAFFDRLRAAGVGVCEFNPVNPVRVRRDWRINSRDHRKILVTDGSVGFVGGVNISSVYSSGSFRRRRVPATNDVPWRDTHVEIRGPAVADMQRSFNDIWTRQDCANDVDAIDAAGGQEAPAAVGPRAPEAGSVAVRVLLGGPERDGPVHYLTLLSAFREAEQKIYITSGYFVPDRQLIDTLTGAARRGVDVRLVLPSRSDFWAPVAAGRSHYSNLLAAGVRIYERNGALLHAKTAVVDGVWTTIGSTNLDFRSFLHNEEANVIVFDDVFAEEAERLFARDLEHSTEITPQDGSSRSLGNRLREWVARRFEYFL